MAITAAQNDRTTDLEQRLMYFILYPQALKPPSSGALAIIIHFWIYHQAALVATSHSHL